MRVTSYDDSAAAALERIVAACSAGDGREPLDEAARLHLRHHGLRDGALWLTADGFALARHHSDRTELDLAVVPAARRAGLGRTLLQAALGEAALGMGERSEGARSGATVGPGAHVTAWSHGDHPGARALAASHGFRPARELLVLTRPLGAADTARGESAGAGPQIRTWRPVDADELLRVNAAAFAHHPEQGSMDAANLAERMAEPWFDPAGLLLATDTDGRLLGFHWTKVHEGGHGEVYVVAVDPASHGRGVGSALLRAGLGHLAAVGCRTVHLYVEADNAPALALYRGLGFTTDHAHVQYARP